MEPCLSRPADTAGVALDKAGRGRIGHGVVARFVGAGHHRQHPVPVAFERIARFGVEDVDGTSVQNFQNVISERAEQLAILPIGFEPAGLTVELVMQPDQVSYHRLQHHPAEPTAELLVVFMQPVNDRFAVRRTLVKLAELLFHVLKPAGQLGYHRAGITPSRFLGIVGPIIGCLSPVQIVSRRS